MQNSVDLLLKMDGNKLSTALVSRRKRGYCSRESHCLRVATTKDEGRNKHSINPALSLICRMSNVKVIKPKT